MSQLLELIDARLEWAERYIIDFNLESAKFLDSRPYELIREVEIASPDEVWTWKFKVVKSIPHDLQFLFGDAIHNIRACCDSLMKAIACAKNIPPDFNFPVCFNSDGPRGFNQFRKQRSKFGPDILDCLEIVQPFNTFVDHNGNKWVNDSHPLRLLNDFWNKDKHETPLGVSSFQQGCECIQGTATGGSCIMTRLEAPNNGKPLTSGDIVLILTRPDDGAFQPNAEIPFYVCVNEWTAPFPIRADVLLRYLHLFVKDEIIEKIRPHIT